jgi:GH25 family lysozyme M1 (1,4-beta-N-acetylmuramidase)
LEAKFCLKNIDGKQFEYPVCFDIEDKTMSALSTGLRTDICKAFCDTIEDAEYYAMIYCNLDWYRNKIDGAGLAKKYDIWLAYWGVNIPEIPCGIWQKSDVGKIDGISGNVDLNESYTDYPEIMKSKGLNGYGSAAANDKTYTVQKGDSLWAIAQKFMGDGTKWPGIKSLNGLKSDIIYPGQVLKIPKI